MKRFFFILCLGGCIIAGLNPASVFGGTEFYVHQSHPQASDRNPGTEERPLGTIQHAADGAKPGDVVLVKPGAYEERVRVMKSGAAGAPIIFSGSPGAITRGFDIQGDYIQVSGFEITNTNSGHWRDGAGIAVVGRFCEVKKNYIHDVTRVGILLHADPADSPGTSDCLVAENRIERAGLAGIVISGRNHLVEANEVSHSVQYPPSWTNPPEWVDADGMRFFGSGHTIRKNYIRDILLTDPGNIDPHIDCFQTWGPARDVVFEQNICDNPNDRMQGFMVSEVNGPVSDLTVRNNVISAFRLVNVYDAENMTIVHNSFKGNLLYRGESGYAIELHNSPNARVMNNIFYDVGGHRYPYLWHDAGSAAGLEAGYNCIYMSDGQAPAGKPWPNDLWQVDPRVVNPTANDFRLLTNSPAIDAGATLAEVTVDLEGNRRPQGAGYDIGAYEHVPKELPVPTAIPAAQPVVWLMFEKDLANGIAEDSSGNGFSARCSPGTSCPMFLPDGGYDGGGAYFFDGTTSYLDFGTSRFGIDQTNEFTLSLWVKPTGDGLGSFYDPIIRRGQYAYPFGIDFDRNGRIWSHLRADENYRLPSETKLRLSTWVHLAVTYKNGSRVLFINGVADHSDAVPGKLNWGYSSSILNTFLGKNPGRNEYFKGLIDDVRIYSTALTFEEIFQLSANGMHSND